MKKFILAVIVIIVLGTGLYFFLQTNKNETKYITEKITRGDIKDTV